MDGLPLHPGVVHFPIGLALAALLAWGWVAAALWRRTAAPVLLAAALQVATAGSAWVAVATGEEVEEAVEDAVPEAAIEEHHERAELFAWLATGLAALALALVACRHDGRRRAGALLLAAGAAGGLGLVLAVGHAGGELVYVHGAAEVLRSAAPGGGDPAGADHDPDGR